MQEPDFVPERLEFDRLVDKVPSSLTRTHKLPS